MIRHRSPVPEMIEVELYRRLADRTVGRTIARVDAPDPWFLKRGLDARTARAALRRRTVTCTRRIGKLLLLDTDGPVLGLRFGMTGRLLVDGAAGIGELEYGSSREVPAWDRFAIRFADGGELCVRDPRRLGGVELDPDTSRLGVDAAAITQGQLGAALAGSTTALKARLIDQARVAGLGNLLADEILWRAGLDPGRPAGSLAPTEIRRLHRHIRGTVEELTELGGSHLGRLQAARVRGGSCPRDGAPLVCSVVGGRTTYRCPRHQS
jgi:formamidopyrimidine-DNA glycosylase